MKKIGLITIIDNDNYGNRLQNYALSKTISYLGFEVETLLNNSYSNTKKFFLFRMIKNLLKKKRKKSIRIENFNNFNRHIIFSKKTYTAFSNYNKFAFVVVGSDQVWNPSICRLRDVDLLTNVNPSKRIAYAGSFGIDRIPDNYNKKLKKEFNKFKNISVREDRGKEIIEKLTNRRDIEIVLDPTMLLDKEEWEKVSQEPQQFQEIKGKRYILNYFLGELSVKRKNEIDKIAEENECVVINILDKDSKFYDCGPSEFLFLEKNAFLICTDSFHSCVFAIIYNTPFVVFNREDNSLNMNSRLNTLLKKFELTSRYIDDKIGKDKLSCDFFDAMKILEKEKSKSIEFLQKALCEKN